MLDSTSAEVVGNAYFRATSGSPDGPSGKRVLEEAKGLRLSQAPLEKAEVETSVCSLSEGSSLSLKRSAFFEDRPFVRGRKLFFHSLSVGVSEVTCFPAF